VSNTACATASTDRSDPSQRSQTGRTHTARTLGEDIDALVRAGPRLLSIYLTARLEPALRECVMVAVSRANACARCTRVHEAWALRAGVPTEELEQLGAGELAAIRGEHRPAVVYAAALAEARFKVISPDAQAVADEHLEPGRQRDIEAIARLISFANLSVNSAHAAARSARARLTVGFR